MLWWRSYKNTKKIRNLCLHFTRKDGQDRTKWKENHTIKSIKIPKTKRLKYGMNETKETSKTPFSLLKILWKKVLNFFFMKNVVISARNVNFIYFFLWVRSIFDLMTTNFKSGPKGVLRILGMQVIIQGLLNERVLLYSCQSLRGTFASWVPPLPPMCVKMDFTQTFQASTKCNDVNSVWSHLYQVLVVLKHRKHIHLRISPNITF